MKSNHPVKKPPPRLPDLYDRLGFVLETTRHIEDQLASPKLGITIPVDTREFTLTASVLYVLLQDALYVDDLLGLAQFMDKLAVRADENAESEMFAQANWLRDELLALPDSHHAEEDQLLAEVKPGTKRQARVKV